MLHSVLRGGSAVRSQGGGPRFASLSAPRSRRCYPAHAGRTTSQPLEGRQLLDVGGGIGIIPIELKDAGIATVTLVETSPAYLEVAQREIGSTAQFHLGDFAEMAAALPDADLVTLDRVVCCYPDAEALLRAAAVRTRQLLAFSYPRNRWYVRMVIALENLWRQLRGNPFRTFVHLPQRMSAVLEAAGLARTARGATLVWTVDVYCRNSS